MQSIRIRVDSDHYNIITKVFSGGEVHVDLSHLPKACNDYNIKARLQSGDDIMQLIMVADIIDQRFCDNLDAESPHCSETYTFGFEDKVYSVTYTPDLNRHDKTYYYVDNYGSTVSKCVFTEVHRTAVEKGLIETLWEQFGGTKVNGFKHLDAHIGAIYGDSITLDRQREIYTRLHKKGFAIANIVLGVGSYTYQYVTRDTHGSAVKATNVVLNGVDTPIQKEVAGDTIKKSAKGRIKVIEKKDKLWLIDQQTKEQVEEVDNKLELVWEDGNWYRIQTLDEIRAIVKQSL